MTHSMYRRNLLCMTPQGKITKVLLHVVDFYYIWPSHGEEGFMDRTVTNLKKLSIRYKFLPQWSLVTNNLPWFWSPSTPCHRFPVLILVFLAAWQKIQILMVLVLVAQSCLTLCDPMNCSPPGSSVHGILKTRILEWIALCCRKICYHLSYKKDLKILIEESNSVPNYFNL